MRDLALDYRFCQHLSSVVNYQENVLTNSADETSESTPSIKVR
jgi:hypothetical protein